MHNPSEEIKEIKDRKINGLLTTLIITKKTGNGFTVTEEYTFTGCAIASYFPRLHCKGENEKKNILSTHDFKPVSLGNYILKKYGITNTKTPIDFGEKTRCASYMYDLEAPGCFCLFVWDFADIKSAKLMDNYFTNRQSQHDTCGEYIYNRIFTALTKKEKEKYEQVFLY